MKLNLKDKDVIRQMGEPFNFYARYGDTPFEQEDLDYLLNTIKKHPCFELIDNAYTISDYPRHSVLEVANAHINQIVFYDKFYHDPACPHGMKLTLFVYLGLLRYDIEELCPNLLSLRYAHVKRWLESVTQKLSE